MNTTSILEPHGQTHPRTKLERLWSLSDGKFCLARKRVLSYDPTAYMTYGPMEYSLRPFELPADLPTIEWTESAFQEFVRAEFSQDLDFTAPEALSPIIRRRTGISTSYLSRLLSESESGHSSRRLRPGASEESVLSRVFDLLCDPAVGAVINSQNNIKDEFIAEHQASSRLLFVLPGFPFKDQNIVRVPYGPDEPDCAEISLLVRLYRLTQALYQVHPYGADVVVLTDGSLYADIFGVDQTSVSRYMSRLLNYRNSLNLQGAVSFIPLKDLVDRSSSSQPSSSTVVDTVMRHLQDLVKGNDDVEESFRTLVAGMKWNVESRTRLQGIKLHDAWNILRAKRSEVPEEHHAIWNSIHDAATNAALKYASVNLMLKWLDLIKLFFPKAIRGTIHPKPGQFALGGPGTTYAWNGIAWADSWPDSIDDIRTRPYFTLGEEAQLEEVVFEETGLPAFYTRASSTDLGIASTILPREGWTEGRIFGREFIPADLEALVELAADDPFFAWHRKPCDREYLETLLRFRLSHYREFGFGVHGIWKGGELIGQCGLQVLDKETDEIEFAIFLGQNYTRDGLGLSLASWTLERCRGAGMQNVFGVVRPDNPAGLALVRRLGGEEIGRTTHFGSVAIKFIFDLRSLEL